MHTARRATASIGEGFDYQGALCGDFVAQVDGCRFGECWLAKAQDFGPSSCKSRLELIKKNIATCFCDVEQPDCLPDNCARPRKKFAGGQALLAGRVKNHATRHALTNLVTQSLVVRIGRSGCLQWGMSCILVELVCKSAKVKIAKPT